ncbi:hypothetical protein MHH33_01565 [Paenisporosarcina sp. FSL H8-0542]|uniref:hypothetical protein n=1 Tax=Paenisporosarcina sp. FSL H8-0542 TaxID=2921401 RepID=UPI00315A976E
MDELKARQEYETRNHTHVLYPREFPFSVTHISGHVKNDLLKLTYKNAYSHGLMEITVAPGNGELGSIKEDKDQFYILNNGSEALYKPLSSHQDQLIFQHKDLMYSIAITPTPKQPVTVDDLLKIANSMNRLDVRF